MAKHILITGGAGFIGSHVADDLLAHGYRVRALDSLADQVHGARRRPSYLHADVELIVGDVRDPAAVHRALHEIDAVFHFAAAVGVGQSMYKAAEYTATNDLGTAVLLEALMTHPLERLIVASSMSVYGEGRYADRTGRVYDAVERPREAVARGEWDPRGPDGEPLVPQPTPETKAVNLQSVYALNKYSQERLCVLMGEAYRIPTVALRFFNVYGPRQALSNPYTGVLAIFASRLLNHRAPLVFEDGLQRRDFVSVYDVARACRLALESGEAPSQVINIGSGRSLTVREIAERTARALNVPHLEPEITRTSRIGDIRHCFADIARARAVLGFEPQVDFDRGLTALAEWVAGQPADDRVDQAHAELNARGLTT